LEYSLCRIEAVAQKILPNKKKNGDSRQIKFDEGRARFKKIFGFKEK